MKNMKFFALLAFGLMTTAFVGAPTVAAADDLDDQIVMQDETETPMAAEEMDESRGGDGTNSLVSTQTLSSTTTGNTLSVAGNLTNGDVNIGDGFGGSGFGSYVMNTGNNSSVNSAVTVNIQMAPAP